MVERGRATRAPLLSVRAVLVAGSLLAGLFFAWGAESVEAQSWRTLDAVRQHRGEEALRVDLSYGSGRFVLGPAEPGVLYRLRLRYDEESVEPEVEYDDARLRIRTRGRDGGFRIGRDPSEGALELLLSPDVPLDLRLGFGAVRAEVDLGGMSLTNLSIDTGASESRIAVSEPNPTPMRNVRMEVGAARFRARDLGNLNAERIRVGAGVGDVTLDFAGEWARDAEVDVDLGVGALVLRFPRGLGVKLERSSFLTALDPQDLVKRGDAYYSTDWEEARHRVTVDIDAALGKVDVRWSP